MFTAHPARYAKNKIAVSIPGNASGFKSPTQMIAGEITRLYSHRESAYMMTPAQFDRFLIELRLWVYCYPKIEKES